MWVYCPTPNPGVLYPRFYIPTHCKSKRLDMTADKLKQLRITHTEVSLFKTNRYFTHIRF
jgi:hypothetical protein